MRKLYFLAGVAIVGLGLAGWATLTTAQPLDGGDEDMPRGQRVSNPIPTPRPIVEPGRLPDPMTSDPIEPMPVVPSKPPMLNREPADTLVIPPTEHAPEAAKTVEEPSRPTASPASAMPGSRQDPSISLEWHGPAAARVGQPTDYALRVKNTCSVPMQKVVVQVRVPEGLKALGTEPKAQSTEGVLLWDIGTMAPHEERSLKVKLLSAARGDLGCQAWVTFTGSSAMRIQVREPKLAVKASAPAKVMIGETAECVFTVTNPGDHPAEKAHISVTLPPGLESARGHKLSYDIGTLQPGEKRTLQVPCLTKTGGEQRCEVIVEGDGGLKASDSAAIAVIQPKLDVEIAGPKLRYLDRKAVYSVKVTNPGDAPAANVLVSEVLPAGFKFVAADAGGQLDPTTRQVKWMVGDLAPGQARELKLEVLATDAGDHVHKVVAAGAHGVKAERELATKVEGLSAILMELVDVDDPIEVNAETAYEVRVTNTGSKMETDIKLVCSVPPQMELKSAQGPVKFEQVGSEVVFASLPQLAPRADVVYKVIVKAKAKGDVRFKATLTTGSLTEPVVKEESTRIYAD